MILDWRMGKTTYKTEQSTVFPICLSAMILNQFQLFSGSLSKLFHILVQDLLINKNLPNSCCFSNFAMCSTAFQKLHPMLIVDNAQFFFDVQLLFSWRYHSFHYKIICRIIKNYLPLFDCTFFVGFWLYRHSGCVLVSSKLGMGQWSCQYEVCSWPHLLDLQTRRYGTIYLRKSS